MDLKGSLIDTRLRIYPSQNFIDFLKTLPDNEDIPANILLLIGRDSQLKCNEGIEQPDVVHLSVEDIENLKIIKKLVNDKTDTIYIETSVDKGEALTDIVKEKEKVGDTPEKHLNKEGGDTVNDTTGKILDEPSDNEASPFITTSDIDWLYSYLQKQKGNEVPYLHTLLEGAKIEMPLNRTIKRNPVLEARCVKLRAQQEAREYRKMTKTVDNVRIKFPEDSISYQLKQMNRQLIAIGQFIISIFAGFLFGFRGVEWMVGNLDFGFRMLLGVMCALVIALAEIYFLAKKLNEELNIPETVQLGGPPKFADESKYMQNVSKKVSVKEHQD